MSGSDTWYAVVDGSGDLISTGTSVADNTTLAAAGYSVITLASNPTGQVWNPSTRTFSAPPPPPPVIDPWVFVQRFTPQEFAAIEASTDPVVRQFLLMLQVAKTINLSDTVVRGGIQYLVGADLITSARATVIGAQ